MYEKLFPEKGVTTFLNSVLNELKEKSKQCYNPMYA
jgi:hypothetical protein